MWVPPEVIMFCPDITVEPGERFYIFRQVMIMLPPDMFAQTQNAFSFIFFSAGYVADHSDHKRHGLGRQDVKGLVLPMRNIPLQPGPRFASVPTPWP